MGFYRDNTIGHTLKDYAKKPVVRRQASFYPSIEQTKDRIAKNTVKNHDPVKLQKNLDKIKANLVKKGVKFKK